LTISLGIGAATTCLLIQSYSATVAIPFTDSSGIWRLASERGRLLIDNEPEVDDSEQRKVEWYTKVEEARQKLEADWEAQRAIHGRSRAQMQREASDIYKLTSQYDAINPGIAPTRVRVDFRYVWLLIGVAAVFAIWLMATFVNHYSRLRRLAEGRCVFCGYNLRGIVDRCPECGNLLKENQTVRLG
jgi:hypothetical protein